MRKVILIIAVFAFMVFNLSAQGNKFDLSKKFQFGVKAGANLSNVYDTQGENFATDPKVGFTTGFFIEVPVWRYFGVQPGLLFSQKGFRATGIILGSTYRFTRTLNYIDMPLVATFKPGGFLTFVAGPQVSFLIKQKDVYSTGGLTVEQQFNNDNIRRNVLSLVGGFDINIDHLSLGARAGADMQNNNGIGSPSNPRYKNVWYQVTVGYRF
jgi:hypothetical protein